MFSGISSANVRHHVKYRENRSNGCGDIGIFRFSKMAAAAILDFKKIQILNGLGDQICVTVLNFVNIDKSVDEIW